MKTWGVVVLAVILAGLLQLSWRVGIRAYALHKLYSNPVMRQHIEVMPEPLDVSDVQLEDCVNFDLGYATFALPATDDGLIWHRSRGDAPCLVGKGDGWNIAILSPHNPRLDPVEQDILPALPPVQSLQISNNCDVITYADLLAHLTSLPPYTLKDAVMEDSKTFGENLVLLTLKGATGMGLRGSYVYSTPEICGLVFAGRQEHDVGYAHVYIEDLSGSQSIGLHITADDDNASDVLDLIPPFLQSFRFTNDQLLSNEQFDQQIKDAGINRRPELE